MPNPVGGTLSNTYRSDRLITPLEPNRATASKFLYTKGAGGGHTDSPKEKWGRHDYGLHMATDSVALVKGHRHYSSGIDYLPSEVRDHTIYDLTLLKRSNVRAYDHLVKDPTKTNVQERTINLDFPQRHTYYSHLSQKDIFPQHKPPSKRVAVVEQDQDDAYDSEDEYDVQPVLAFDEEFKPDLRSTTKGSSFRREVLNDYWRPKLKERPEDQKVNAPTFNAHKDYAKELKETHYSKTHRLVPKILQEDAEINLNNYKPNFKHDVLKSFNNKFKVELPDIRNSKEKRHTFFGTHTMSLEHG